MRDQSIPKRVYEKRTERICKRCGVAYWPTYKPQQYCSWACANWVMNEAKRKPAIPCGYCGTPFHPTKDHNTRCCSKACITAYERKHGRATRKRTPTKVVRPKRMPGLHVHHTNPSASPIRLMVFERDNWTCLLCGYKVERTQRWPHPQAPSIDHIIPVAHGGSDDATNLRTTHLVCNLRRPMPKR
jgi:predicted nucleic acid-binding Zn ribbon protein